MTSPAEDVVDTVRTGYTFDGACVDLGVLVQDGQTYADAVVRLPLAMMNRHGLVAGATGTGKTKTLQLMAEQLSTAGVPVFLADMKGDLSGLSVAGEANDKVTARASETGQQWEATAYPTEFLTLGGLGTGVPVRVSMTSFGPQLLSKVLDLNETQSSSLGLVFHWADTNGMALLDLKDLRAVMQHLMSDEGQQDLKNLGGLSRATAGVILRELVGFEQQGADAFFGEPEFDTADLRRTAPDGRGVITCLELPAVQDRPKLFSTFLMWMLADLFDDLPEVGDIDKPILVFFFDEAHLLFDDASNEFLDTVAQTVRLIRSKGVGVFFVTQTPKDVPSDVLGQLGNRVQHALRAFTPEDAKALKATVSTFPKSSYDLEETLTSLGIGEAVVTVLSERGAPTPVAWTRLRAPQSLMGPADPGLLASAVTASPLQAEYGVVLDRESAYERLTARLAVPEPATPGPAVPTLEAPPLPTSEPTPRRTKPSAASVAAKGFAVAAAATLGREIVRGLFGTSRKRRRR